MQRARSSIVVAAVGRHPQIRLGPQTYPTSLAAMKLRTIG
jgi:hypothetical protein